MNIYIIGAGGFAAECHLYLSERMKINTEICFGGFLAEENKLYSYGLDSYFKGDYKKFSFSLKDRVIIAVGSPLARESLYNFFVSRQVSFYTLIAPSALISPSASFEEGNIFCHNVFVGPAVKIGKMNLFNVGTGLGHDAEVGSFNMINGHVAINGFSKIGDRNILGTQAALLPYASLGSNCKLSPGSIVYKKIKDNSLATGNPALKTLTLTAEGKIDGNISR